MRERESGVGRADHNPQDGERSATRTAAFRSNDSADQHAHGTHGKGRGEEKLNDGPAVEPTVSKDNTEPRGTESWGSEGSGGSVVDKRPKE